jgi:predicted transcriptional regulator
MLTMNEWQKVIETAEKLKAKDLRLLLLKVYFKAVAENNLKFKYSDEMLYWSKKSKKDILIYLEANQRLTQKAIRKECDLSQSVVRLHDLIFEEMKSEKTS